MAVSLHSGENTLGAAEVASITSAATEFRINSVPEEHARLAAHYSALRALRGNYPVFCLEHGLDVQQRTALISAVGTQVRQRGISIWWRQYYLPLLVAASETGYSYLGTGTDFWPKFCSAIGAELGGHERQSLSDLFELGHQNFGLRKPVNTPWTQAFRHIAWPISNAIAPKEIHRPLANALRSVVRVSTEYADETALVERLRYVASHGWSSRLVEWLTDANLAASVALHLLRMPDPHNRLSGATLDRIIGDLTQDHQARRYVEQAVAIHEAGQAPPAGSTRLSAIGKCLLELSFDQEKNISVSLNTPRASPELRAKLHSAFTVRGIKLSPWGKMQALDLEYFFSGIPVPLHFDHLPDQSEGFLPGLAGFEIEPALSRRIAETAPDLSRPLLFAKVDGAMNAIQLSDRTLHTDTRYLMLVGQAPESIIPGIVLTGSVMGLACLEIDTSSREARSWLERRGFEVGSALSIEISSGLVLGHGLKGPLLSGRYPILLRARPIQDQSWPIKVTLHGSDHNVILDQEHPFVVIDPAPGEQILVFSSDRGRDEIVLTIVDTEPAGPLFTVEVEPPEPTMDDFLGGNIVFRITSPLPVDIILAAASVSVSGTKIAESPEVISRFPAIISSTSALLSELRDRTNLQELPRDAVIELALDLGGLWRGRWKLGWTSRECVWNDIDGRYSPYNDDGPLPTESFSARKPLEAAIPDVENEFALLLPNIDGRLAIESGLCTGPRTFKTGSEKTQLPSRFLRCAESTGDGIGLNPCLEAYAAWASASAAHSVADAWRRNVAGTLEEAAVAQLCGDLWIEEERKYAHLAGDRWEGLVSVAVRRNLAAGEGFPTVETAHLPFFRKALQNSMQAALPDLWIGEPESIKAERLGEILDSAVDAAYEALRSNMEDRGLVPIEESDAGSDPAEWMAAVRVTRASHEMANLKGLILPLSRAAALSAPEYSALTSKDVIALLNECHVDLQRSRWIDADDMATGFTLWIDPKNAIRAAGWKQALEKFLDDRPTCRAVRYAALRFKSARASRSLIRYENV